MDKNSITGWILIAIVFFGWMWYSTPNEAEMARMQHERDSIEQVQQKLLADEQSAAQQAVEKQKALAQDSAGMFFAGRNGSEQDVVLDNGKLRLVLSTKGGTPVEAEIKGYKNLTKDGNVKLFSKEDTQMAFLWDGKSENLSTADIYFEPINQSDTSVTMRLTAADGGHIDMEYTMHHDAYMVDLNIKAEGMGAFFPSQTKSMGVQWQQKAKQQEKGYDFEQRYSSLTYKERNEGTDYLSETGDDHETPEANLDWVAFKNQFFSCVMIAGERFSNTDLNSKVLEKKEGYLKQYNAQMQVPFHANGESTKMQLYYGPNDYHLLQHHNDLVVNNDDPELEELVYLGWPLFRWINRFFIIYLFDWLTTWGLSMGVVLLLLTLIVKALVYPATRKSYLSSAKMRVLKPKMDEIAAQYPDPKDAMQKQQAVMQMYSRYGVSPMGGCLPMMLQMPIWIALFNFVPNAIELRGQPFLWADDLSAYDELLNWGTDLWLIGDHLSIFCLLFCATNIVNTIISMKQQQNAAMSAEQEQSMKMMRWMMYIMPVMFFFMFNNYASGLNYYYFLSGLTSILMMWYLRRTTDDKKLLAQLEARYQKNKEKGFAAPGGLSGMAAKLQALQQLQQEQQERQRRERESGKK